MVKESNLNSSRIALYVAGYGNVAKELLKLLPVREKFFLAAIINSRSMAFIDTEANPDIIEELLDKGSHANLEHFISEISKQKFPVKVFIDCTANREVASVYGEMALRGISVVSCNKIAFSSSFSSWLELRRIFENSGASLHYETTVGAALPVVYTIQNLIKGGDKVERVEAILSGTLNYLLSSYNGTESLRSLIIRAKSLGYTEPDPRLDLSGADVARKALILSREMGLKTEPEDITYRPLLPDSLYEGSLEDFYNKLDDYEESFKKLYKESLSRGERLRYIARISDCSCTTGFESLPADHQLALTEGTDNKIIIYSRDYPNSITIAGAGAGSRQTAAGVYNDILKTVDKFIKT